MSTDPSGNPAETDPHPVSILLEGGAWGAEIPDLTAHIRRMVQATFDLVCPQAATAEISVLLTDNQAVQGLNREWRGQDKPTNVLSFPATEVTAGEIPQPEFDGVPLALGDIALAYETVKTEAAARRMPFIHHVDHLIAHGVLHLLGYDHLSDAEAEMMEDLERRILAKQGIADPYAEIERE